MALIELLRDLRRVAELYDELATARLVTTAAPQRDAHLAALAAEHDCDAALEADRVQERRREARRLEGVLRDLEAKQRERQARREAVADAHAADALAHELDYLREQRDALEAQVLRVWEEVERETASLAAAQANTDEVVERVATERVDLAASEGRARTAEAEVEAELQDRLGRLPARIGARLARLASRVDNPIGGLGAGGTCDACGQLLPPQQAADADRDRALPVCTGCGRFVVARRGARRGEWT